LLALAYFLVEFVEELGVVVKLGGESAQPKGQCAELGEEHEEGEPLDGGGDDGAGVCELLERLGHGP
jgi:hypothetical protein